MKQYDFSAVNTITLSWWNGDYYLDTPVSGAIVVLRGEDMYPHVEALVSTWPGVDDEAYSYTEYTRPADPPAG